MQSGELVTAIPSVNLSVTRWYPIQTTEHGSRGLHSGLAKHSSFLIPTMVGGDIPFHLKFALKVTYPPLKSAEFDQYVLVFIRSFIYLPGVLKAYTRRKVHATWHDDEADEAARTVFIINA